MYHLEQPRLCESADASSNNGYKYENLASVHKCETMRAYRQKEM